MIESTPGAFSNSAVIESTPGSFSNSAVMESTPGAFTLLKFLVVFFHGSLISMSFIGSSSFPTSSEIGPLGSCLLPL